jgi:hypothetical protein
LSHCKETLKPSERNKQKPWKVHSKSNSAFSFLFGFYVFFFCYFFIACVHTVTMQIEQNEQFLKTLTYTLEGLEPMIFSSRVWCNVIALGSKGLFKYFYYPLFFCLKLKYELLKKFVSKMKKVSKHPLKKTWLWSHWTKDVVATMRLWPGILSPSLV